MCPPVTTSLVLHTHTYALHTLPQWRRRGGRRVQLQDPRDPMRSRREAQRGTRGQGEMRARTYAFQTRGSAGTVTNTQNLARIPPRVRSTVTHAPIQKPDSAGPLFPHPCHPRKSAPHSETPLSCAPRINQDCRFLLLYSDKVLLPSYTLCDSISARRPAQPYFNTSSHIGLYMQD